MAIFAPKLEGQIQAEAPVQAPQTTSPFATALRGVKDITATLGRAAPRPVSEASRESSLIQGFGTELSNLLDLQEGGEVDNITLARRAKQVAMRAVNANVQLPDNLKGAYEAITGTPFAAAAFDVGDEEQYYENQRLQSEQGLALRSVAKSELVSENITATPDAINKLVLQKLNEKAVLDQQIAVQDAKLQAGMPIEPTPILESIQNDYQILSQAAVQAEADGIVTRGELRNIQLSTRNLIASKYGKFESNKAVKAVVDQMNGLVQDIAVGVSTDPLSVQLDAVQVALQKSGFDSLTISTVRAMVKQNPETFKSQILTKFEEKGKTFADALVEAATSAISVDKYVDIFGNNRRPELSSGTGENPSLLPLPDIKNQPENYTKIVESISAINSTTKPENIINNAETRNSWLNTLNITASAVASQSDEFILGEKLLSRFADNGIMTNLDAVYRTDPLNAAQTNDVLQQALSAERVRQKNELDQRLSTGDGQYFKVDQTGKVVFDMEFIEGKFSGVPQGDRRLRDFRETVQSIEEAGGLEAFMKLPEQSRNQILQGSNLENIITTRFGSTLKLVSNLRMIDGKLQNLNSLATKYQSATDLFSGAAEAVKGVLETLEAEDIAQEARSALDPTIEDVVPVIEDTAPISAGLIDRKEAGLGGYSSLFNNAERKDTAFKGYDVSTKTLAELYEFSNPSGPYGQYVKRVNPEGVTATPMGRYQFVGTTLKEVAERMGLDESTVFNQRTQDIMFLNHVNHVVKNKSKPRQIAKLKSTWDGFKKLSDAELLQMIKEIEGSVVQQALDIPSRLAPQTSLRPMARPTEDESISQEVSVPKVFTEAPSNINNPTVRKELENLGYKPEFTVSFNSMESFEKAKEANQIPPGTQLVVGSYDNLPIRFIEMANNNNAIIKKTITGE